MRMHRTAAATGLISLALLVGCSDGDAEEPTAAPTVTSTPSPEETTETGSPDEDATGDASEDSTSAVPTTEPPAEEPTDAAPTETEDPTGPGDPAEPPAEDLAVPEGSGCSPGEGPLPDGQWYVEVVGADPAGVEFDLACFFLGEEADKAALEDGETMVPVPNGYYVRNDDPTLRTADVAASTQVLHYPTGDPGVSHTLPFPRWAELVEADDLIVTAAWLTVDEGAVVGIEEQWTP